MHIRPAFSALALMTLAIVLVALQRTAADASPADLSGLWMAKHIDNTADISGPLLIQRVAGGWRAQISGQSAPVTFDGKAVSFALPAKKGSFTGRIEPGNTSIFGHWRQSATVDAGAYAFPVTLRRDGPDLWRGTVVSLADPMAFYLVIKPGSASGATTAAYLINPERDLGWMWDVDRLESDGNSVKLLASETGRRKGQVQADGIYRDQDDVLSIYFSGRGGTYDFTRVAANATTDFYPRGRPTAHYAYAAPPDEHDGWPVARVEDVGISRTRINAFMQSIIDTPIDSVHSPEIHAILIARHGKLVVEEYFHGENRDKPHETRSAAKSITATLYGAAIQAGLPVSTSTHVYSAMNGGTFPPGLDPLKRSLTVESLLTMSAGLDCDDNDPNSPGNENTMLDIEGLRDYYKFALDLKMIRPPGQKSVYCSIEPNLVGGVLSRTTHRNLPDLFHDLVAEPLQISRYYLALQPSGEPYMGGGVRLLPRDFMKFGQLVMDGGTWNGHRILSREYAARASSAITYIGDYKSKYGYFWWIKDYPYNGGTVRGFAALGNGGQVMMSIPKLDIVMEFYGANYNDRAARLATDEYIPNYILPAIVK